LFDPFFPSERVRERFQDLAQQGGIGNVFLEAEPTIRAMNSVMQGLTLFDDFNIQLEDFLPDTSPEGQSALPPTPMPSGEVIQTAAAQAPGIMNQGLTPTENALLSEEEKQMRLRSKRISIMAIYSILYMDYHKAWLII
jgi:hypothetical protein